MSILLNFEPLGFKLSFCIKLEKPSLLLKMQVQNIDLEDLRALKHGSKHTLKEFEKDKKEKRGGNQCSIILIKF